MEHIRLKPHATLQSLGEGQVLVVTPTGKGAFSGILRLNETAVLVATALQQPTTAADIAARLSEEYDAPKERIAADVRQMLDRFEALDIIEKGEWA